MPVYTLKNTDTDEVWEQTMTYESMKELIQKNSEIIHIMGTPSFISGVSNDSGRLPEGFKDRMRQLKKQNPLSKAVDHII